MINYPTTVLPPILGSSLGIVIQPDDKTLAYALGLAPDIVGTDGLFLLAQPFLPHITLYQSEFFAPTESAPFIETIVSLRKSGRGLDFQLGPIIALPSGWIFWMVEPSSANQAALRELHEEALSLHRYLDLEQTREKALILESSGTSAAVVNSMKRYGYSRARELSIPHITLGFNPRLAASFEEKTAPQRMRVAEIQLCLMGEYGRMEATYEIGG